MSAYVHDFHDAQARSARDALPLGFDLLAPDSVVDVGCGVDTWLSAATELGTSDVQVHS